jgi:hypothetical protein
MTTYNNLEIAQVSLTFSGELDPSISTRTFDLSTLNFLPNVPFIDQIEVERIFDTGYDTKFGENVFTIADRRQIFILPKAWYSINEQTKILTVVDLSTIPTYTDNNLYYPSSRTFVLETLDSNGDPQTLDIPNFLVNNVGTSVNGVVRQADTVIIRRKTLSIDSIVTFAPGTRLTTTQLNLQFNQLKFILQELVAKVRNEIILKFDENAVDGPFLGGSDLKMSNNYITDLNSLSIGEVNEEFSTGIGAGLVSGATYATNVGAVYDAITKGTVRRTTMNGGADVPFSGHFTATPIGGSALRITNMADALADTDAATLGQIRNANNITLGTLDPARIANNSLSLTKLLSTGGQGYTLPVDALANSGVTANSYGASSASNTNNMVYMTVDDKGRITNLNHRNLDTNDLPNTAVTAQTYGQAAANNSNNMVSFTVDTKGRLTGASQRSLLNADLPNSTVSSGTYGAETGTGTNTLTRFTVDNKGIITSASHRSIEVNDLPATSVTGAGSYGQAAANNSNNMLRVTYDAKGRVTTIAHRSMEVNDLPDSIPLTKLSAALSQGYTLPSDAIANNSISISQVSFATGGIINSAVLPSIDLANINPANRGSFVLPDAALNNIVTATTYNTQPVKDITVDAKGRVTTVTERAIADGDIPTLSAGKITSGVFDDARIPAPSTAPTAGSYGSINQVPVITVDAKGRINTISTSAALQTTNLSDFASASNTLIDNRALSRGAGTTYDAGSRKIINVANPTADQDVVTKKFITDSYTPTTNLGSAVLSTIQSNSVYWDSANSIFTASRSSTDQKITGVAQPTANNHAANKGWIDSTFQTISGLSGSVVPLVTANALAWDSGNSVYTANNGSNRRIANVQNPVNAQDVVTRNYLEANALVVSGGVISAATAPITNMTMRAPASIGENDAVNYGFIQNLVLTPGTTLVGSTTPQIYRDAWSAPALSKTSGHLTGFDKYQRTFTDLGAVNSFMILLEADSVTKTFVPYSAAAIAGTVHDGYFWLDTSGGANKVLNIWLTTGATPSGNLVTRNFGLSRLVSGATATTSSTGLVAILSGNDGGIAVDGSGFISLRQATNTQIGGIKQGTGLTITSGVADVNLTDSTNTTSSSTAASATSVNTLRLASMLLNGSQQMTGKLSTVAGTASIASLNIPVASAALATFSAGDLWNESNTLKFRTASATKQIAFTDDATTSTKGLVQITSGNDGGIAVSSGSISLQQATSTQIGGIKIGTGLSATGGTASVNLTDSTSTASSTTAASATAVKAAYDYAVGVQTNLTTTNNNLSTTNTNVTNATNTANAALPKAGGTMTGMIILPASTTSLVPLRFVAGSAPASPTSGDIWYESNTLQFKNSAGTKTIAFTDSSLTGSAATANSLTTARQIALTGDVTGSVNFDGSAGVTIATTIAANSVALGTDTTGNYVATAAAGTGISVTGSGSENAGITITNTDLGSAQNIYKTVALAGTTTGDTSIVANNNSSTLTLTGGTGISLAGNNTSKTITITNTSTPPSNFGTVLVDGTTSLVADSSSDTLNVNAGTGISLTATAGTDTLSIANSGVTQLTGTANQVAVSASTGSVTLSLPQDIHTTATPTFSSVTAKNLTFGNINNTIISTNTNGNINLDPNGTGIVNIQSPLDVDSTLNVDGASTLVGNTTMQGSVSVTTGASKIALGADASTATTSINRQNTTAAPADIGDLILRVPANRKAFLVANNTITTAAVANDELITKAALDTALVPYVTTASLGTYMSVSGNLTTGSTDQVLGTGASATGSFIVKTADTARLTINAAGTTSIANGLSVTGNAAITGNLNVSGITTLTGGVVAPLTGDYTSTFNSASLATYLTKGQILCGELGSVYYKNDLGRLSSAGTFTINDTAPRLINIEGLPHWFNFWTSTTSGTRTINLFVPANAIIYVVGYSGSATFGSSLTNRGLLSEKTFAQPTADSNNTTPSGPTLIGSIPTPFPVSASDQTFTLATAGASKSGIIGLLRVK